jgi:hypothetical protein
MTMKARVLADLLEGRLIGNAEAEITRAVHPADATCESDVALAITTDAVRLSMIVGRRLWLSLKARSFHRDNFKRRFSYPVRAQACQQLHTFSVIVRL